MPCFIYAKQVMKNNANAADYLNLGLNHHLIRKTLFTYQPTRQMKMG